MLAEYQVRVSRPTLDTTSGADIGNGLVTLITFGGMMNQGDRGPRPFS